MAKAKINKGERQACLEIAQQALKLFDRTEIDDYAKKVFDKAKSYENLGSQAAIKQAMADIDNETMANLFNDCTTKANNIAKFEPKARKIQDETLSIDELSLGSRRNKADNWHAYKRAAVNRRADAFSSKLDETHFQYMKDGQNDDLIFAAIDGDAAPKEAQQIAKSHDNYVTTTNTEMVVSNALPLSHVNTTRFPGTAHVAEKLLRGGFTLMERVGNKAMRVGRKQAQAVWRNFIKQHIDIERTFKFTKAADYDGAINEAVVDEMLDKIFDNITYDYSSILTKSLVANDREAIAKRAQMFFHWKDAKSWGAYNRRYGHGTYMNAIFADIEKSGSKIGTAEFWGDSPEHAFTDLKKLQYQVNPEKTSKVSKKADRYFNQASGANNEVSHATLANFGANLRAVTSMARTGKIVIQSLNDLNAGASWASRWGGSYLEEAAQNILGLFNLINPELRKEIAGDFAYALKHQLGYSKRFVDSQNAGEITNKITDWWFKRNGLQAWERGNRLNGIVFVARHLGKQSEKSFESLHPDLKFQLDKYQIGSNEWDILRKNCKTVAGKKVFMMDNAGLLTKEQVAKYYEKTDKTMPLHMVRNDLYNRLHAMFMDASDNFALRPREFSRAYISADASTVVGQLARTLAQFKMFTIDSAARIVEGAQDARGVSAKMRFALQTFVGVIPLAYATHVFDSLASGKTPVTAQALMHMKPSEQFKFVVQIMGSGLGMFAGVLDERNINQGLIMSFLQSPTTRLIEESLRSAYGLVTGDMKKAKKHFGKALNYVTPFATIPVINVYMHKLLGEKMHLEPGQQQLYGK